MKITIIDGQGGRIGRTVIEQLKKKHEHLELYAIGTNSAATAAMLKAGADYGATGDNALIVNAADSDLIVGPVGIIFANALLGEITPAIIILPACRKLPWATTSAARWRRSNPSYRPVPFFGGYSTIQYSKPLTMVVFP